MISLFKKTYSKYFIIARNCLRTGMEDPRNQKYLWVRIEPPSGNLSLTPNDRARIWEEISQPSYRDKLVRHLLLHLSKDQIPRLRNAPFVQYTWAAWAVLSPIFRSIPFPITKVGTQSYLLRSVQNQGLADILKESTRIHSFTLSHALKYSLMRDTRFLLIVSLLLAFLIWLTVAPEILTNCPRCLTSPDFELLQRCVRDTFVEQVCTSHRVSSPCECGEGLNKAARDLLIDSNENLFYDPLDINKKTRARSCATYLAVIILTIVLSTCRIYLRVWCVSLMKKGGSIQKSKRARKRMCVLTERVILRRIASQRSKTKRRGKAMSSVC